VPGGNAGFQPGDGGSECEHGEEVGVVRADDPEHVRRDGQRAGDMGQGAAVGDAAATDRL
jgi:hypothetical protein